MIPVAGKDELTNFNLIFWQKARKDITDGHIWFSVFGRSLHYLLKDNVCSFSSDNVGVCVGCNSQQTSIYFYVVISHILIVSL